MNDAPVAITDRLTISEDSGQVRIEVLSNDYDVDGDELRLQGSITNFFGQVDGVDVDGEAVISDDRRAILFTPDPDSHGLARLRYTVGDGDEMNSGSRSAEVYITVESVYDPVVARNDGVVIGSELGEGDEQSLAATIDVLRNERNPDGGGLSITGAATDSGGSVVVVSEYRTTYPQGEVDKLAYEPASGFVGTETITYTVQDEQGSTSTAEVRVEVVPETLNSASVAASGGGYTALYAGDRKFYITSPEGEVVISAAIPDGSDPSGSLSYKAAVDSIVIEPVGGEDPTGFAVAWTGTYQSSLYGWGTIRPGVYFGSWTSTETSSPVRGWVSVTGSTATR